MFNAISVLSLGSMCLAVALTLLKSLPTKLLLVGDFCAGSLGPISINFPVILDSLSLMFLATIFVISSAVIMFSRSYMSEEVFFTRFHVLVWLFILSMLLLIVSPNMVSLLLGWDGLGVTSYLLVIYFQNPKAFGAGMLTALTNRIGDVVLLIIIAHLSFSGSWNFYSWSFEPHFSLGALGALLIVAACTKSAQIPFSAWLPAAMAAPTPVSSLVHSSTLVTAGVYLMIRFNEAIFDMRLLSLMLWVGTITMLVAGVSALFEIDMKKIVALSTLSQLGLMVSALGLALPQMAFFHLITHAFFKALLFMSVGSVIHMSLDYQDLRSISAGPAIGPSFIASMVANLSLCGLPFMAGFYSKDLILEASATHPMSGIIFPLFYLATLLTAFYSSRFICSVIISFKNSPLSLLSGDGDPCMPLAFSFLLPLATLAGSSLSWLLFSTPIAPIVPTEGVALIVLVISLGAISGVMGLNLPSYFSLSTIWSWGNLWGLPISSLGLNPLFLWLSSHSRTVDSSWVVNYWTSLPTSSAQYSVKDAASYNISTQLIVFFALTLLLMGLVA